jgi:hypothetical protein
MSESFALHKFWLGRDERMRNECAIKGNSFMNPSGVPSANYGFVPSHCALFVMHNQHCILMLSQSISDPKQIS